MAHFFKTLDDTDIAKDKVTSSAFCQARLKLKPEAFIELNTQMEQVITLEPTQNSKQTCRELGLDLEPMRLRLIRIDLESGQTEILITSMVDSEKYPHCLFKDLYHYRWPVEEDYKVMKNRLEIENWAGESVISVEQDFYAKVFVKNLAAALIHPIRPIVATATAHRKYKYQINFTQVLSRIKNTLV